MPTFDDMDFGALSGMFNPPPEDRSNALNMALLHGAGALLSNQSPRLGPGLGAALIQGSSGYEQALKDAAINRLRQMQGVSMLLKQRKAMEDEQRTAAALSALKEKYPEHAALIESNPKGFVEAITKQALPEKKLETIYDEKGREQKAWLVPGGQPELVGGAKTAADKQSQLGQLISEMNALPEGDPRIAVYKAAISKATTHAPPQTVVSMGQPQFFTDPSGQAFAVQAANRPGEPLQVQPLPKGLTKEGPPQKPPGEIQRMAIGMTNAEKALNRFEDLMKDFDPQNPSDQVNMKKRAQIETVAAELLAQGKEAIALGALTGPDMEIMSKLTASPTSIRGIAYGGKGIQEQINELKGRFDARRQTLSTQFPGVFKDQTLGSQPEYVEVRKTKAGRILGKKANGDIEEIKQ